MCHFYMFSENRRRLQQGGSKKNTDKLDDILRREWASLADRDKIPYFERALSATEHKRDQSEQDQSMNQCRSIELSESC